MKILLLLLLWHAPLGRFQIAINWRTYVRPLQKFFDVSQSLPDVLY